MLEILFQTEREKNKNRDFCSVEKKKEKISADYIGEDRYVRQTYDGLPGILHSLRKIKPSRQFRRHAAMENPGVWLLLHGCAYL